MVLQKKAITLIEVLIAVIIFGVGILTVMTMIIDNIFTVDKIKNKTTATTLAKEGIEIVYNIRDTNLLKAVVWNCAEVENVSQNPDCSNRFSDGQNYKVSIKPDGYYSFDTTNPTRLDNLLYYHTGDLNENMTGFWFDHNAQGGEQTIFGRYIKFDKAKLGGDGGYGDSSKILKIESHVLYKRAGYEDEVVLESFIGQIN